MKKFNITNSKIKVRLNETGDIILEDKLKQIYKNWEEVKTKGFQVDENGYTSFPITDLMFFLGDSIKNGIIPFDDEILLENDDLIDFEIENNKTI